MQYEFRFSLFVCVCLGEYEGPPPTRWERFQNYIVDGVFNIMADFTEDVEESESEASAEGNELSVKK